MAIDGIGKSSISGTASPSDLAGVQEASPSAEFVVQSASGSEASSAPTIDGPLISQLQSGRLTKDQYLDIRAEQAVHHLVGKIPDEKVGIIRETLREQLDTDPLLMAMVRRATTVPSDR